MAKGRWVSKVAAAAGKDPVFAPFSAPSVPSVASFPVGREVPEQS